MLIILNLGAAVVVLASSIWVLIDAKRLGMKADPAKRGMLNNSPTVWFIGCLGVWIVAFPLYLVVRSQAVRGGAPTTPAASHATLRARAAMAAGAPGQAARRTARRSNATPAWVGGTSLGLGIASIPFGLLLGLFASPLWMIGLSFGLWGVVSDRRQRGLAVAGIVTSILGLIVATAAAIFIMLSVMRT